MERAVKYVLYAIGALVLSWLVIRLGDVLFGWMLFGWFFHRIQDVGVLPNTISSAIAVWCVAAIILAGPTILAAIFAFGGTRRKAIVTIASGVSIWFVMLFVLAGLRPKEAFFNPYHGESNYAASKDANGNITLFPKEYKFDPMTGAKLTPLDPAIAQEYRKQKGIQEDETLRGEELQKRETELAQHNAAPRMKEENLQKQNSATRKQEDKLKSKKLMDTSSLPVLIPSSTSSESSPRTEATQPTTINFNSGVICDGDEGKTLDYSIDIDKEAIVIPLKEGCYGPTVIIPNNWRKWGFRNATGKLGWAAFLSTTSTQATKDGSPEFGPIGLSSSRSEKLLYAEISGDHYNSTFGYYNFSVSKFRLQGNGAIRLIVTVKF